MNNGEHVTLSRSNISCGITEAYRLGEDSEKVLYRIATHFFHPASRDKAAYLMFSGLSDGNAAKFAKEIAKHFGDTKLLLTGGAENPNTGNIIYVWLWEIPHAEFRAWYVNERVERAKKT